MRNYRGKRKDNGEWVYGYFTRNPRIAAMIYCRDLGGDFEVILESVGQSTEYGNIYQGDVVEIPWYDNEKECDVYIKSKVVWRHSGWQCDPLPNHGLKEEPWPVWLWQDDREIPKIIGNITDSPGLEAK